MLRVYIRSISIKVSNQDRVKYNFKPTSNLITSSGKNTLGKTSLVRFLLWGLGLNISLTNSFFAAYSETEIILEKSNIKSIIRKNHNLELISISGERSTYDLPNDEEFVLNKLFSGIPKDLLEFVIGYFYFDQDGGYKSWNKGPVVQKLSKSDSKEYKISIQVILSEIGDIDFKKFAKTQQALKQISEQTKQVNKIIRTNEIVNSSQSKSVAGFETEDEQLRDKIAQKRLELARVTEKEKMYTQNLKDQKNLEMLITKLKLQVNIDGSIYEVTNQNLVQDPTLEIKLSEYANYYKKLSQSISSELHDLTENRKVLLAANENDPKDTLFDEISGYSKLRKLLTYSGISSNDTKAAHKEIMTSLKEHKKKFENDIKSQDAYAQIWNEAVKLARDLNLSTFFSYKKNRLLDESIKASGAKRTQVIFVYRLAVLKYFMSTFNFFPPLVVDSPASSEMDERNLEQVLKMIKNNFSELQILIATNQNTDIKFDNTLHIENGVIKTLTDN